MGRADGKRVRKADPMYFLIPHFLTKRYDSMNMITIDIPVEPLKQYINQKRRENIRISHLALTLSAYIRTMGEFPDMNNFIVNRKIYHRNEISVSMVVLRPNADGDTFSKIYFEPTDTVFDVQRKIEEYIDANRKSTNNSFDKAMNIIIKLNGLMRFCVNLIRFFDNHNLLPKAIINLSPFHASLLITNLASIRTNHIYHHTYEFGTTSVAMAMGNTREVPRRSKGEIVFDTCIPLGVVMDERICSGHYFALAFEKIKKYLANPELMEQPLQLKDK